MKKRDKLSSAYLRLCELNNLISCNSTLDRKYELQLISIVLAEILDILEK